MNSLTTAENQQKLSEREIELGTAGTKNSWHNIYRESAWIFVGGLPFDLTEGDVICVFSQYGEIVNINMVRDKKTGKTKGYAFICYEDQRSTILAVDNFNTTKFMQRTIRVDHVKDYRPPDQDDKNVDDLTKIVRAEGVAPRPLTPSASEDDDLLLPLPKKEKKKKKDKKMKKEKKATKDKLRVDLKVKKEPDSPTGQREKARETLHSHKTDVKQERTDSSYEKYANGRQGADRRNENRDDERRACRVSSPMGRARRDRHRRHSPANGRHRSQSRDGVTQHSTRHDGKGLASRRRPLSREDHRRRSRSPQRHAPNRRSRSRSRERRRNSRSPSGHR